MKLTKYFIAAAAVLVSLTACDSDLEKIIYDPAFTTSNGDLVASQANIQLTAASTKNDVLTLTWGKTDFGVPAAITYTVEMDMRGGDFTKPYTLASTGDTTVTFTGKELNTAVLKLQELKNPNADPSYDEQKVDVRIVSSFSEDVEPKVLNTVALNITPYAGKVEYRKLSVPGSHQGWDPMNYAQALYETNPKTSPDVYVGYIYMDAGSEFKFADGQKGKAESDNAWAINWGSSDGTTLEPDGPNIYASESGCYYITVDLHLLTFMIEKRDWSIVGDAVGGWDNDIDLVYDAGSNKYYTTYTFTGEGEFKFRANHGWDINLGKDPDGDEGDLKLNGDNIKPLPGEYTVALSFVDGYPVYSLFAGSDLSEFAFLSLPGTMNGWAADTKDNVILDLNKTGEYSGYIYVEANGEFKIADGSWDANWGSADLLTLEAGGANIAPDEGMYAITANVDELTLKLSKTDWSIIGDFNGWGDDVEMTWNATKKVLEATVTIADAGGLKFRCNKDWAVNLGGADGKLFKDGANIDVAPGTYLIELDLQTTYDHHDPTYTITAQ